MALKIYIFMEIFRQKSLIFVIIEVICAVCVQNFDGKTDLTEMYVCIACWD
jgi:hypothetical protein